MFLQLCKNYSYAECRTFYQQTTEGTSGRGGFASLKVTFQYYVQFYFLKPLRSFNYCLQRGIRKHSATSFTEYIFFFLFGIIFVRVCLYIAYYIHTVELSFIWILFFLKICVMPILRRDECMFYSQCLFIIYTCTDP